MTRTSLILSFVLAGTGIALAQGTLAPAGAPAPTMKTLQQIEPRRPISSLPFSIAQSGSYYFESNLTATAGASGVTIATNDVTLDLMGFTLTGVTNSFDGITVTGIRKNIVIRNGIVRGCGQDGVDTDLSDNSRVSDIRSFGNNANGIRAGQYAVVENCSVAENGNNGIGGYRSVMVLSCSVSSNGANGIDIGPESKVRGCLVTENKQNGVVVGIESSVESCHVVLNGEHGISVDDDCDVRDCTVLDNGRIGAGVGVIASGDRSRIERNHIAQCDVGITVNGRQNMVSGNIVLGNSDNYDLASSNSLDLVLSELPETIDWPARVRLAGDLVSFAGLVINSDNVSVDLDGFALIGSGGGSSGISVNTPCHNLIIRNGMVRDWSLYGIDASDADNSIVEDMTAYNNGQDGIRVGDSWAIRDCTAKNNGRDGIFSGGACSVEHCTVYQNARMGFNVGSGGALQNCVARDNTGNGFALGVESFVHDCSSTANTSNGFVFGASSVVRDCLAANNSRDGIRVFGEGSRVEDNHVVLNAGAGIRAGGTDIRNFFVRNTAKVNGTDYVLDTNNVIGEIMSASVPDSLTNASPWANFRF